AISARRSWTTTRSGRRPSPRSTPSTGCSATSWRFGVAQDINVRRRCVLAAGLGSAACSPTTKRIPTPEPVEPVLLAEPLPLDFGTWPEDRLFLQEQADMLLAAEQAESIPDAAVPIPLPDGLVSDLRDFDIPIHYNERVQFWLDYFRKQ